MMATITKAAEKVKEEFREVGNTGVFIARTVANHKDSMSILKRDGLRALRPQEAFVKMDKNQELKKRLEAQQFYLDGKGSALSGYHTFNEKGELTQREGEIEKNVRFLEGLKGPQPLLLTVYGDDSASLFSGRFCLNANLDPSSVAGAVVGVHIGSEAAAQKIEVSNVEEGVKLTGVTTERLMALQRDSVQELSKVTGVFGSESLPKTRKLVEALRIKE